VFVEFAKTPTCQDFKIKSTGFHYKKRDSAITYLSVLVRFVQVKRRDFSSTSASVGVAFTSDQMIIIPAI